MADPAENIEQAKRKAIETLLQRIDQMEGVAYSVLMQEIEEIFDIKGGQIVTDKDFINQLNKLSVKVLDLLQSEPQFRGPVSEFVKRMEGISEQINAFQKSVNGLAKLPSFEVAKHIVIHETLEQMLHNGLNQQFVQPLRELIYLNATGGLGLGEAKLKIKAYIQGGRDQSGKLGSYLEQTAQQATDTYAGILNKKILQEFNMNGLLMTGSLIDNSSPQCRFVVQELGGQISRENWPLVVAQATKRFPLIEGTTFDNLPLNRLHWGCRHSFYPLILKKD